MNQVLGFMWDIDPVGPRAHMQGKHINPCTNSTVWFLVWVVYFISFILGSHLEECTGLIPDSVVLRDHSWQGSIDHMWCQRLNPGQTSVRQAPYMLINFCWVLFLFLKRNNQNCESKKRAALTNHWLINSEHCYRTELWIKSCLPKQCLACFCIVGILLRWDHQAAMSASESTHPNQMLALIRECWGKGIGDKSACMFFSFIVTGSFEW